MGLKKNQVEIVPLFQVENLPDLFVENCDTEEEDDLEVNLFLAPKRMSVSGPGAGEWRWQSRLNSETENIRKDVEYIVNEVLKEAISSAEEREQDDSEEKAEKVGESRPIDKAKRGTFDNICESLEILQAEMQATVSRDLVL